MVAHRGKASAWCTLLCGLWVAALFPLGAIAHRVPECLTVIEPSASGKPVEVVHRLHRHDVEAALAQMGDTPDWDLESVQARAVFALYLESHFALASGDPAADLLPLRLLGAELENDYLLVYQELHEPLPSVLSIRSDVLREIFPRQVNLVHVRTPSGTLRLTFADDVAWQSLSLDR